MPIKRRDFLYVAATSAALAAFGGAARAGAADVRSNASASYSLELEGKAVAWLRTFSGADPVGDVVAASDGQCDPEKHIGNVSFSDLKLTLDLVGNGPVLDWIQTLFECRTVVHNLAVVTYDANHRAISRLEVNGELRAVNLPQLDAATPGIPPVELVIAPERVRWLNTGGGVVASLGPKTKAPAGFRLRVGSLQSARVSALGPLSFGKHVVQSRPGAFRDPDSVPVSLELSNLTVDIVGAFGDDWRNWFVDYLVTGNRTRSALRDGELEILAADMTTVLYGFALSGLGPVKMTSGMGRGAAITSAVTQFELFVENVAVL